MKEIYVVQFTDGYEDVRNDYAWYISETKEKAIESMNELVDRVITRRRECGEKFIRTDDGNEYVHLLESEDRRHYYEFDVTRYEIDKMLVHLWWMEES